MTSPTGRTRTEPAVASTRDHRMAPAGVRGFTLIELLVVIGIMLLLMGLTVGAIVSRPRVDAMLGAEQALAGAIRQARHTARTTGQPVVLKLKKSERQIAGLLREPLWHALERWPTVQDAFGVQVSWPGRTGTGLKLPEAFCIDGDGTKPIDPARLLLPLIDGQPLTKNFRLWRGRAGSSDFRPPLLLTVAVLPPVAGGAGVPNILPLVLVGDVASADSYENAQFGLLLVNTMYTGTGAAAVHQKGVVASWEVLGWFGSGHVEVSSIQDLPAGQAARDQGTTTLLSGAADNFTGFSESGPLTGSRWTELALLFDGTRLVLYRDGRRVGEKAVPAAAEITGTSDQRVYVGVATIAGTQVVASNALIDDVRLERLGDALAGNLPSGVQPDTDYTITCHPDGRVEGVVVGAASTTLKLTSSSGVAAELTVEATGAISASQVTP